MSPLKEVGDYFIINSSLHDEFDSFKEKYTYRAHSFIRQVELLQLYSKECVHMFGNKYLMLTPSEVDMLVEWVLSKRQQFDAEGQAMFSEGKSVVYNNNTLSTGS